MAIKKSSPVAKTAKAKKVEKGEQKKKATVKTAPVKPVKKGVKKKPLVVVSGESCFWINNGQALCSMKDLHEALLTMNEDQFLHHTGMGRNDFSAWTADVLGDKKCASDLLKAATIKDALLVVEKHLKGYSA